MIKTVNVEVNVAVPIFGTECTELVITDHNTGAELAAVAVSVENLFTAAIIGHGAKAPGLLKTTDKPRPKYTDVRTIEFIMNTDNYPRHVRQRIAIERIRSSYPGYTLLTQLNSPHTITRTPITGLTHFVLKIGKKSS